MPVILLDVSVYFDEFVLQLPHVSDMFQMRGKHHHGERTTAAIFAEIEIGHTRLSFFNLQNFAGDAAGCADLLISFREWNTLGDTETRKQDGCGDRQAC